MVIFNSYVKLPEGIYFGDFWGSYTIAIPEISSTMVNVNHYNDITR